MPELPEVETIAVQLNEVLSGRTVGKVVVYRLSSFWGDSLILSGKKVRSVTRRAKVVGIEFEKLDHKLLVHLKMTGQLIFVKSDEKTQKLKNSRTQNGDIDINNRVVGGHPTSDWVKSLPSKHTRVEIAFKDGSTLFFNDMRAFGWVKLVTTKEFLDLRKSLPPDVVDETFTLEYFEKTLAKYKRPVKIVLLDQQLMGGIGNIYANDALNLAKVSPLRKSNELTKKEMGKLYQAIKTVIDLGIKYGGASAANYVDTKGLGGTYQDHFLTYKREREPCKNCGQKIVKIKLGGRGTFYCPNCQK